MSEYNKTYRLNGEFFYRDMYMPDFTPLHTLQEIENYEFDDKEIIVTTYPKCGKLNLKFIAMDFNANSYSKVHL